mmetsp:Transcript_49322/g.78024  ORF Transcript_49322/g.78024 Transcript_49322/m.78024 type:complete len:223 (-) Transcript_49322:8-676(-)
MPQLCEYLLLAFALPVAHCVQVASDSGDESSLLRRESLSPKKVNVNPEGTILVSETTEEAQYWVTDGCHAEHDGDDGECHHKRTALHIHTATAAVVCCNSTGYGVVFTKQPGDCYGSSLLNSPPAKNYAGAKKHCEHKGHRLCTFAEVYAGRTCNLGCGMDCEQVWTSTRGPCQQTIKSHQEGARCMVAGTNGTETMLDHASAARCCNDEGIAANWKWKASY